MNRRRIGIVFFGFLYAATLGAQQSVLGPGVFLPAIGSTMGYSFAAPPDLYVSGDPRSSVWNPAAQAERQLPAFSIAGGVISSVSADAKNGSGLGFSISGSGVVPLPIGIVWAVSDGLMNPGTLPAMTSPSAFSALFGLSKQIYDNLNFGFGLGAVYAFNRPEPFFIQGSLGTIMDFPSAAPHGSRLGLSFLGIGPWYDTSLVPTPLAQWESRVVDAKGVRLSLLAMLGAPAFSDVAGGAGVRLDLGRMVRMELGWSVSASQIYHRLAVPSDSGLFRPTLWPSISIRLDGSSFLRSASYEFSPAVTTIPLGGGTLFTELSIAASAGEKDLEGPRSTIGPLAKSIYSPPMDGSILVPLSIQDPSPIQNWTLTLWDPSGKKRYEASGGKRDAPRSFLERLFEIRSGTSVPDHVLIPLDRTMPDGPYELRLQAADMHGNASYAEAVGFLVDGTAPYVKLVIEGSTVFSPNGDGVRDLVQIDQEGSIEDRWAGTFYDSLGKAVATLAWADGAPLSFKWDGRGDTGELLPNGIYSYVVSSVDRAGNSGSATIPAVTIDRDPTAPSISVIGKALSIAAGSNFPSVTLSTTLGSNKNLESWDIGVVDAAGSVRRKWRGSTKNLDRFPSRLAFDGRTVLGEPLEDGHYRFTVSLAYAHGERPVAVSGTFLIDSREPSGRVRSSLSTIILDRNQRTVIFHDLSPEADWRGILQDSAGLEVAGFEIGNNAEPTIEWNGFGRNGNPLAEGAYTYYAEGVSHTGLIGRTEPIRISIESGHYEVALIAEKNIFSASAAEKQRLFPRVNRRERIISYALSILSVADGSEVRRFEGIAPVPSSFAWDGRDAIGLIVDDGDYEARFTLRFDGGATEKAPIVLMRIDSTAPKASIGMDATIFSPNGDGRSDTASFSIKASRETLWNGLLIDEKQRIVRSYEWPGTPPERLDWDGTDGQGAFFPDGIYRLRLNATDSAGNTATIHSALLALDSRIPSALIETDRTAFSPNGDGFADRIGIRFISSFADGLTAWRLGVSDQAGRTVRTLAAEERPADSQRTSPILPPSQLIWDGKNDKEEIVSDGGYKLFAELNYAKGDRLRAQSSPLLLDNAPPELVLGIDPLPFSPDDDGVDDVLNFRIEASDASPIAGWMLTITDPSGYPFVSFSGARTPPETLTWDGRNASGELVEAAQDYSYTFRLRDSLGNTTLREGKIPTDVFVLQDGDRLRIRVSSIIFPPSSASLSNPDPEIDGKNMSILDRIAAILKKYPSYRIRIEGHAANVSGTEREERLELAPLSLSRAQAVAQALILRGIQEERLETHGLGGTEPLVPHGDALLRWRNRRVEFILMR